ncbi:Uncharacterised protein [Pseudomonas fluorescens]|uniref:Uncharacterized protein n=1 Tax=Pseudomonas fluorescens TaxID=294 RepID=A0A379IEZ8_PSEFL|nr:Uncharacterised protein [Pseudomonas fluorescens]
MFELTSSFGLFPEVFGAAKLLMLVGMLPANACGSARHSRDENKDRYMLLSKHDQAQIERRLIAIPTKACETAKAEIHVSQVLAHLHFDSEE